MIFVWFPALAAFLVLTILAVLAGLWSWTLRVRRSSPPFAWWTALVLLALDTALVVWGVGDGVVAIVTSPSGTAAQEAAQVSLGISIAMYNSAFGLIVALVVALGLGFCRWRWRTTRRLP
jgi:hypothetical protein